jgi:fimbrial chaperone protein
VKIPGIRNNVIFLIFIFVGTVFCHFLSPSVALSGEWRVMPIRLDLGREAKSGVVTVINESDAKLQLQMKAFEWTQDSEGKDLYTETNDIIFFPKIMSLEKKNEDKLIRAGIKMPAAAKEKTYRLFVEEIPEPKKAEGVHVAIAIRFGVPIFVKPLKEDLKGEIGKIELSKGSFSAIVHNKGNVHFIINSIEIKGKNLKGEDILSKELSGWYLLNGASRLYKTDIPHDVCKDISKISITLKTDNFTLDGNLDVDSSMCAP